VDRAPGAASFDAELQQLIQDRARCADLHTRLKALETEREAVERGLHEATDAPSPALWDSVRTWLGGGVTARESSEAQLDGWLARLRDIERERQRAKAELETLADVDLRLEHALEHKHAQLQKVASHHPCCRELAHAHELCAETRRALDALDLHQSRLESARDHAELLVGLLEDANSLAIADVVVDVSAVELLLAAGKYTYVKSARQVADALARSLRDLRLNVDAKDVAGPTAPLGLTESDLALVDVLFSEADLFLGLKTSAWLSAARRCKERLHELHRGASSRRRELEVLMSQHTRSYHELLLKA